jgi:hypothetical protein
MSFFSALRWRPGIGDPTVVGWLTVWAYLLGAVLAGLAARASRGGEPQGNRPGRVVWIAVCLLMTLLAINKQLDLQSLFTDIGRVISKSEGWYEGRREVQRWFVVATLACSGVLAVWFTCRFRSFWRRHALLVTGLAFLLTFIVVRAISFHHVDELLGTRFGGIKMNWLLELTGIGIIAFAALRELRSDRQAEASRQS